MAIEISDAHKIATWDDLRDERYGFTALLKEWPKLPSPYFLRVLGECAKYPEDHDRGKLMQRELHHSVIPFKSECEGGAGFWDRITQGAWRGCQTEGWLKDRKASQDSTPNHPAPQPRESEKESVK